MRATTMTTRALATGQARTGGAASTAETLPPISYWDDDVLALKAKGYRADGTPDEERVSGQVRP